MMNDKERAAVSIQNESETVNSLSTMRTAMQQALEALEEYRDTQMIKAPRRAIAALREALTSDNMSPTEHAVIQQALEHKRSCAYKRIDQNPSECTCGVTKAITALREALDPELQFVRDWNEGKVRRVSDGKIMGVAEQAEQKPVAKTALKNCIYFDSIDFNQTPPYLRYDTGDSTPKENWTIYCDIQEDLRKNGYELTDSDVDHDTVCGDVTPIEAPVRTKDLTDDEILIALDVKDKCSAQNYKLFLADARAVIAAYKEKNNANNNT